MLDVYMLKNGKF